MSSSVPKDWTVAELRYFLDWITYGFTNPMPTTERGPFKLTAKDIKDGKIDYSSARHTSKEAFDKLTDKSKPRINDVLLTKDGTLGRVSVVDRSNVCINQSIALLRPNERIDPYFLKYLLQAPYYQYKMEMDASGTTIKHIYITKVDKMEVAVPPIEGQRKVVGILKAYDDLIEISIKSIQVLKEMAENIYNEWFVHFRFRKKDAEIIQTPYGSRPKQWKYQPIGNVITTLGGGTPSTKEPQYWEQGDINWYTPSDLTSNDSMFTTESSRKITEKGLEKSSAKLFPPYSVMMTSRATLGVVSINTEKACTNQGFITCMPNDLVPAYYLYFWIKDNVERIINLASGSTFKEINKTTFRKIPILIPDIETMTRFLNIVSPIANQIEILQKRIRVLRESRDLLLPKLTLGEVDQVTDASGG